MSLILNRSVFQIRKFKWLLERFVDIPNSQWYYQLKAAVHYDEKTLQQILFYKVKSLLPKHQCIYYNRQIKSIKSPFDVCIPDFLLWDNTYEKWYIIEVELENHQTEHIKKQLNTFYHGDYSDTEQIAKYVQKKASFLDMAKFKKLISQRPTVILMSDIIKQEWIDDFSSTLPGTLFCTLQVYSDDSDNFLYRFSGDFPQEYASHCYCTLNKHTQALKVHTPQFFSPFNFNDNDTIRIYYKGEPGEWQYSLDGSETKLRYLGTILPIDEIQSTWKLIYNDKKQFHLQK